MSTSKSGVFRILQSVLSGKTVDQSRPDHQENEKRSDPYHAVTILATNKSCVTSKALKGIRFLSTDAPVLPLEDCDVETCPCRYKHHADRRDNSRRARERGEPVQPMHGKDHRVERDRRATEEVIKEFDGSDTYFDYICERLVKEHAKKSKATSKLDIGDDEWFSEDQVWYESEESSEK